jgi:serine protease Do
MGWNLFKPVIFAAAGQARPPGQQQPIVLPQVIDPAGHVAMSGLPGWRAIGQPRHRSVHCRGLWSVVRPGSSRESSDVMRPVPRPHSLLHGSLPHSPLRSGSGFLRAASVAALTAMGTTANAAAVPDTCDTAHIVARSLPAIVNITAVKVLAAGNAAPDKPAAEQFEVFVGSGVIIDPAGIIVTNKHVIKDSAMIRVTFHDRSQRQAQLIAAGDLVDLAVLKVDVPKPLPILRFANSDAVRVGQKVIAIGNPLGLGTSVSTGVVSALDRNLMRSPFDDYIQTDATINPGNSGGPMLDCDGNVIGIDTALLSNSKVLGSIGIGFAMPSNVVKYVASRLIDPQTARPNWVGLQLETLTADLAVLFGRPDAEGAIVAGIDPDGPAVGSQIVPGDIITRVDGKTLPDARAVLRAIMEKPFGEPISFSIWRDGQMMDVTLRGQAWPHVEALRSDVLASSSNVARAEATGLGLHLTDLTPADRKRLRMTNEPGVLIDQVASGSLAAQLGLVAGDVIERVGPQPATSPAEVQDKFRHLDPAVGDRVALLVREASGPKWVSLYIGRVNVTSLVTAAPLSLGSTTVNNAAAATVQH